MPQTTEFLRSLEVLNVAGMLKPHLKNLNLSCCPVCVFLRPHYASVASFLRYAKGCLPRLPTSQPLRRTKDAINVFVESVAVFFCTKFFASDLPTFWSDFLYLLWLVCGLWCLHASVIQSNSSDSEAFRV